MLALLYARCALKGPLTTDRINSRAVCPVEFAVRTMLVRIASASFLPAVTDFIWSASIDGCSLHQITAEGSPVVQCATLKSDANFAIAVIPAAFESLAAVAIAVIL